MRSGASIRTTLVPESFAGTCFSSFSPAGATTFGRVGMFIVGLDGSFGFGLGFVGAMASPSAESPSSGALAAAAGRFAG